MQYTCTTVTRRKIIMRVRASPYRYGTPYWYGGDYSPRAVGSSLWEKSPPYQYGVPYQYGDARTRMIILRVVTVVHVYCISDNTFNIYYHAFCSQIPSRYHPPHTSMGSHTGMAMPVRA